MKIFIVLFESPLKILKIAVYRFFKDLPNGLKNGRKNARSWIKSIKIDKICDVMLDI